MESVGVLGVILEYGMVRRDKTWRRMAGMARRGSVRLGQDVQAWRRMAGRSWERSGKIRQGRHGEARHGVVKRGTVKIGKTN